RRGAFHRIGKPDIQGKLCAFAERAKHQAKWQPGNARLLPGSQMEHGAGIGGHGQNAGDGARASSEKADGSKHQKADHDADAKAEVADSVDDECFFGGFARGWTLVVVSDQQIRADADTLPTQVK